MSNDPDPDPLRRRDKRRRSERGHAPSLLHRRALAPGTVKTTGLPALASALCVALLVSGCSPAGNTPSSLSPRAALAEPDGGADALKMDTGPYAIVPGPPYGTAGDDRFAQGMLESQRIAEVTVGPWEVKPQLVVRDVVEFSAITTGRFYDADSMRGRFADPLPEIAERRGLMAGFASLRRAPAEGSKATAKFWNLQTAVMRFPSREAAAAAAAEMAAADPPPEGASGPRQGVALRGQPAALAALYPLSDGREFVRSFIPDGPFVLYQGSAVQNQGSALQRALSFDAKDLVSSALDLQQRKLENFVPTPADKLAYLPLDPSGFLMARLIGNPSRGGDAPQIIGAWIPAGWVHFEDDPMQAATWLREAGVDWVAQRLSTVYRTRNADTSEALLRQVVEWMRRTAGAKPAGEVPGLPRARCFQRDRGEIFRESPESWQRVLWNFKCAAATGRYVFTVYASSQKDAAQRISAQWRILAGK